MKKVLAIIAVALALGGCAQLQAARTALQLTTASIANPVTQEKLADLEAAVTVAFTGLKAYKTSCSRGLVDTNCRANVAAIQQYTRQVPSYLAQLRSFVDNNDQINAQTVYNQIVALIGNIRTEAANRNVNLGGT